MLDKIAHHLLLKLDPERAHSLGKLAMRWKIEAPGRYITKHKSSDKVVERTLRTTLDNPLGLAAGFDKNGELIDVAREYGFGFVEVGSVTYRGGKGNPKPRLFRLTDRESLLNRLGLNGKPAEEVAERLARAKSPFFGVNIAKTHDSQIVGDKAIEDIHSSYKLLKNFGLYIVINISCPNTTEGKTFEDSPSALHELLDTLNEEESQKPILVKLSPTLTRDKLHEIMKITEDRVDGYVCGNTLPSGERKDILEQYGKGGISGAILREHALNLTGNVRLNTNKLIIGCGGISNAEQANKMKRLGANLIQAYTGFIYQGSRFAHEINKGLDEKRKIW